MPTRTGRTPDRATPRDAGGTALSTSTTRGAARWAALTRLVGDPDPFLASCWGRRSHLERGVAVDGLLSADDVDALVTSSALRAPAFRVVRGGTTLPASSYTRQARIGSRTVGDLIDVGRVLDHLADGATVVLQGLHRYWPPVAALCRALSEELTHPVQANAYLTPPVAQGLRVHADAHDVFAIQTHGRKRWVLYEGEERPDPDGVGAEPTLDTALEPGDCLYLPTGVHHAARTVDAPSIHLTLGVRAVTWADVVRDVLTEAADDPALAEPLPAGFGHDPAGLADAAAARLAAVADGLTGPAAAATAGRAVVRAAERVRTGRGSDLSGQLREVLRLDAVDDGTVVRPRARAEVVLQRDGDTVVLRLPDRLVRLPAAAEPALRLLLDAAEPVAVHALAAHLDASGRRTLVRRLVREGVLVVDG